MSRRTIVAGALSLAFVVAGPATAANLDTPEAALREYLQGVAQADLERVLEASAVDELEEAYRFEEWIDRFGTFDAVGIAPGPTHSSLFSDAQVREWDGKVAAWVRRLAYSLLAPETLEQATLDLQPMFGVDAVWATDLMAELDESRLADLSISDIQRPASSGMSNYLEDPERAARVAGSLGADELVERVALVYLDGRHYAVGHTVLRFGDEWAVWEPSFRFNPTGAALPTTRAGFYELTSE